MTGPVDPRANFEPASVTTEADESGDQRTILRALRNHLYLVVKPHGGDGYEFPHGPVEDGETMREAAERQVGDMASLDVQLAYFIGNAPTGHVEKQDGNTVFFHRAEFLGDDEDLAAITDTVDDYKWVTKDELLELVDERSRKVLGNMVH